MPQAAPSSRAGASIFLEPHDGVVPVDGAAEVAAQIAAILHRLEELRAEQAYLQAMLADFEAQYVDCHC